MADNHIMSMDRFGRAFLSQERNLSRIHAWVYDVGVPDYPVLLCRINLFGIGSDMTATEN